MRPPRPASASVSAVLRLAAAGLFLCAAAAPAVAQRPASHAAADAADYRLTMANVEKLVPLAKALHAIQDDADVRAYLATQKPIFKQRVEALEAAGHADDGASMELLFQLLDGQPKIHHAFVAAGLTPRDYALTSLHLGANWMAVGIERQFKKPGTAPAGVAGQNWTLVHQNQARIEQIMAELEKYPVKLGGEEEGEGDEG